ncbi:MAG: hypothetical protein KKH32_14135 [Bacteroidetes bacterium]|nr:hypothetical protein [Bacteroidota bacterium]
MINNFFEGVKKIIDKVSSYLFKKYINSKIKDFGEMLNFHIDSQNKSISLDVLLKGEKENINVIIEKYEVNYKDNTAYVKFKNITASREWIEVLIKNIAIPNYAPNNLIEIDSSYAKIIDLLI